MTTITYRDGVMAADSRAYGGDKVPIGSKVKIKRMEDGTLVGATSTIVGGSAWAIQWWEDGCPQKPGEHVNLPSAFTLLAVKPNGEAYMANDHGALTGPLDAPFLAIGSGEQYALGAMAHGANAIDAVRASCRLDVWSELPVYAATHGGSVQKINEEE